MEHYNLFSIPLFRSEFYLDNSVDVINMFQEIKSQSFERYTLNSFTSYGRINDILEKNELLELKEFILNKLNATNSLSGIDDKIEIDHSWFSINKQGGYHEEHNHLPSIWSGVYYVKADNNDANITFVNKNLTDTGWPYMSNKDSSNSIVSQQTSCSVSSGILLIFPGYLRHKVEQQTTDNERIAISFNTRLAQ